MFHRRRSVAALTLVEVVLSTAIAAMTVSGILYGYTQSAKRAEWSGYSLAAQALGKSITGSPMRARKPWRL